MKSDNELERSDLAIDSEIEVDCDVGREITVYIETWFDVDKKFGIHTDADEGTWMNMYGKYNPFENTLHIECEISSDDGSEYFDYEPTSTETQIIKEMITEKIFEEYKCTPWELCEEFYGTDDLYHEHCNNPTTNEKSLQKAADTFYKRINQIYPNLIYNAQFEHVDESGYWFSYELLTDDHKQNYVVRHNEI